MKKILFKGCGTAIITPFDDKGVNFDEFKKLIEFQISEGVDALIVCGTTGESSTMTLEERKQTIEFAVKTANHRVPIIAGTGGNCTQSVIDFTSMLDAKITFLFFPKSILFSIKTLRPFTAMNP